MPLILCRKRSGIILSKACRREKVGDHPIEALQEKLGDHPIEALQEKVGDRAEQAIGNLIEKTPLEVPELQVVPGPGLSQRQAGQAGQVIQGLSQGIAGQSVQAGQNLSQGQIEPEPYQWYRVPVPEAVSWHGSPIITGITCALLHRSLTSASALQTTAPG